MRYNITICDTVFIYDTTNSFLYIPTNYIPHNSITAKVDSGKTITKSAISDSLATPASFHDGYYEYSTYIDFSEIIEDSSIYIEFSDATTPYSTSGCPCHELLKTTTNLSLSITPSANGYLNLNCFISSTPTPILEFINSVVEQSHGPSYTPTDNEKYTGQASIILISPDHTTQTTQKATITYTHRQTTKDAVIIFNYKTPNDGDGQYYEIYRECIFRDSEPLYHVAAIYRSGESEVLKYYAILQSTDTFVIYSYNFPLLEDPTFSQLLHDTTRLPFAVPKDIDENWTCMGQITVELYPTQDRDSACTYTIQTPHTPLSPQNIDYLRGGGHIINIPENMQEKHIVIPHITNITYQESAFSTIDSHQHITYPVYYRMFDSENIVIHPTVVENVVINLDSYKNQVDTFYIRIGGISFSEIGRVSGGILFKIIGTTLPSTLNTTGTYYITDESGNLITTGKYTSIS